MTLARSSSETFKRRPGTSREPGHLPSPAARRAPLGLPAPSKRASSAPAEQMWGESPVRGGQARAHRRLSRRFLSPLPRPARSTLVAARSVSIYWAPALSGQGPGPAGVRGVVLCPGCGPSPGEGRKERDAERAGRRLRGPPARTTEPPPFLTPRVHENDSQKLPTTSYLLKVFLEL